MKCAIITCSEYKRKIFAPRFSLFTLSLPLVSDSVLIINLPYTSDKFFTLSSKKKKKLAEKLYRILQRENVFCIYLSGILDCQEFSDLKYRFYYPDGKALLKKFIAPGTEALLTQLSINRSDLHIALFQKKFNHANFEVLSDLAQNFNNITVISNFSDSLEEYADKILALYGLSIHVSDELASVNSCDVLFLLDEINNVCINEKTVIIDLTKNYPFYCLNSLKFEMSGTFNRLLPYFGFFDDICIEFILYVTNHYASSKDEIISVLRSFGCKFKTFCAKSKNNA